MSAPDQDNVTYRVFESTFFGRLAEAIGWALGWLCFAFARAGWTDLAERWVDVAILLRRSNRGAIRTVGYLNALRGRLAIKRGWVLVEGRTGPSGAFANKGFFARYEVAARNQACALALIKRWERDAIPGSLRIYEAHLDCDDSGAEGILWVYPGRSFFATDEDVD
ncbi:MULTISPECIES: hypothetical protein [unclassified Novosphingobium]|uniref:hypothetical protein n=1 Tax=unclassified Novosphingobium TaxID=2644732 RepID=UPI0025E286B8|nr:MULTISPECIES: hypothetical protein [unclassified Novosphingobium]HQV03677.1 hypothetical protein [Novosphingobium sp.]